jgi:hypothetical protein
MLGRCAQLAVIPALLLAGCGSSERGPTPLACVAVDPAPVTRALEHAPGPVALADGTSLSRCVRVAAHRDVDLQLLGVRLTRVADDLRPRAAGDPVAALRLGYLVGAVRRGAAQTPGLAAQLARRLEQVAALDVAGQRARGELQRGIRLGEAGG